MLPYICLKVTITVGNNSSQYLKSSGWVLKLFDVFSWMFLQWVHLLLKGSFIQRPPLHWWLSVERTVCRVCGCGCGQKPLQPAIHHQILIRFHHSAMADIWFIALGALFEFLTVNKGSWEMPMLCLWRPNDMRENGENNGAVWTGNLI